MRNIPQSKQKPREIPASSVRPAWYPRCISEQRTKENSYGKNNNDKWRNFDTNSCQYEREKTNQRIREWRVREEIPNKYIIQNKHILFWYSTY